MEQEINNTDIIQTICAVVSTMATVIGFTFVIGQLRLAQKANQISTYENLFSRMHDIHMFFFNHPEYKDYFYGDKELESNDVKTKEMEALVEMYADFLQQIKLQVDLMPKTTADGWNNYADSIFNRSPALRAFFNSHKDWYPSQFYKSKEEPKNQR